MGLIMKKSAQKPLFEAVFKRLKENIDIPIFDSVPDKIEYPYMVVETVSEQESGDKLRYGSTVAVDIVNFANTKESKTVKNINDKVVQALNKDLVVAGYDVLLSVIDNVEDGKDDIGIYSGLVTINYTLEEAQDG